MQKLTVIFLVLFSISTFAQISPKDTIRVENYPTDSVSTKQVPSEIEVLANIKDSNAPVGVPKFNPTKAGLYSAILPGLGQYYNKKYYDLLHPIHILRLDYLQNLLNKYSTMLLDQINNLYSLQ